MTDEAMRLLLQASKIMEIEQLELVRDFAKLTRINALEEAAKVCDPKGDCPEQDTYGKSFAAAIRALKEEKDVYTT